jgi:hypothetical protein
MRSRALYRLSWATRASRTSSGTATSSRYVCVRGGRWGAGDVGTTQRAPSPSRLFQGPIPEEWCPLFDAEDAAITTLHLANNALLCDAPPACVRSTVLQEAYKEGSCLRFNSSQGEARGGFCDATPPSCEAGACLTTPTIVTRLDRLSFNFSGVADAESDVLEYRWMLGTAPGLENAKAEEVVEALPGPDGVTHVDYQFLGSSLTNVRVALFIDIARCEVRIDLRR